MHFYFESESRPKDSGGHRDVQFSFGLGEGRTLVLLGAFSPDSAPDFIPYFAVEIEHYAQERAEKAWREASAETILRKLCEEADRLMVVQDGRGFRQAAVFAAVFQDGKMDYVSVGGISAAYWDGRTNGEAASGVSFLETGAQDDSLPLRAGRQITTSDIKRANLAPGSAVLLSAGYAGSSNGSVDENDRKRLAEDIADAYGEPKGPAKLLLERMLRQWDKSRDFTGLVIEARPDREDGSESGSTEPPAPAARQAERVHQQVQRLIYRLEGEIAKAEHGIEQAVNRGLIAAGTVATAPESAPAAFDREAIGKEVAAASEAAYQSLKTTIDNLEARIKEAVDGFSTAAAGLDGEHQDIEALERRLESVIEQGLAKLPKQQPEEKPRKTNDGVQAGLLIAFLFLFMISGVILGIYGRDILARIPMPRDPSPVAATPAPEPAREPLPAITVKPVVETPSEDPKTVQLAVLDSALPLPVGRDVFEQGSGGGKSPVTMDQAYEMVLETLRRNGYSGLDVKNVISFLLDARNMDAGRRLELLNLMAFKHLYIDNGISNFEDRSWAVNVFLDRFPLDDFDNPGHTAGEPGVFQIKLDDETFGKLSQWKQDASAPQNEVVPIILQFMFVDVGGQEGPDVIDGRWGPESRRKWRSYMEKLRSKGLPGVEDWIRKNPLEPAG